MEPLKKKFRSRYYPNREVAIDEMMVPFKGRHGLRVRIRGKPHPSGFKVYALSDSRTGYFWFFFWVWQFLNHSQLHLRLCVSRRSKPQS